MSKEELIQKIMNCCFADDSGNFWEKFENWKPGESFYTSYIDPDQQSKKLYKVHELLWKLQGLKVSISEKKYCELDISGTDIRLGSDSIISIYWHWERMQSIFADNDNKIWIEAEIKNLENIIDPQRKTECSYNEWDSLKKFIWCYLQTANTIGGFMVFPRHNVPTINTARNYSKIKDRFDLTLECIRRFYAYQPINEEVSRDDYTDNPLFCYLNKEHWKKDMEFFKMFDSFEEYIDFFCLDAWVTKDKSNKYLVKNLLSDEKTQNSNDNKYPRTLVNWNFNQQELLPKNAEEWWQFYTNIMSRLEARNKRIAILLEQCEEEELEKELYDNLQ